MRKTILVVCMSLCCVALRGNAATAESYGPVQGGETLYRIALKYRQTGVPVSQVMTAIFEANPAAFEQGDINRLKVGVKLKIPPEIVSRSDNAGATAQQQQAPEPVPQPAAPASAAGAALAVDSDAAGAEVGGSAIVPAADAQQAVLPEPKPPKRKKKQESDESVFRYSYELAYIHDDNIRLAQNEEDIREDQFLSASLRAKGGRSLDDFTLLNYGGSLSYNKLDTFETLDNYEVEANVRYRFALRSGFTSPIYTLGARIGGQEFDTEMRDATFVELSADLNKWITTTINMTTGLGYRARESKSEVFDTREARVFVNFDTNFSNTDLVYTTLTYINGDTVSSATPSLGIVNAADAIEPDDAFGGVAANQFAYRLKAHTGVFTLGYNRILTRDLSLDFSARYIESQSIEDSSIGYDRTILRASLLGRF